MPTPTVLLTLLLLLTPAPSPADDTNVDPHADYSGELPRIEPRSPEDALEAFEIMPDYAIELVAAEPLLSDPVAISFDAQHRLYAVCMRGYSEQSDENLGEIRRLVDGDGDGVYDESTVFADGLSWPTGVLCYARGIFVAVAPDIRYLRDHDGDGRADENRLVYTGFGRSNVQGLLNSLRWGIDNRVHGATSSSAGTVRWIGSNETPLSLRGRDFSFDPAGGPLRPESGGSQHGLSFDNWGRKYVCHNSRHAETVMIEERYLRRSPYVAAPNARVEISAEGGQAPIHRISQVEPWRIVRTRLRVAGTVGGPIEGGGRAAGYFTSSTGITVYRGDLMPELRGQLFVGDVGSNIIHRKQLTADGLNVTARRADADREFLASRDVWFRPVQLANGPDGALYVVDMYREVIEHPASLPPMIKKHLDLTSGRDRGRIYRVVPASKRAEDRSTPRPLARATARELVTALGESNGWRRDTAARLLYERQDEAAIASLTVATRSDKPLTRLHALWTLAGQSALTFEHVKKALADADPRVRVHACRLAERVDPGAIETTLVALADDPDIRVRYQLALTLGEFDAAVRLDALARIVVRDAENEWVTLAVLTSARGDIAELFTRVVARGGLSSPALARKFADAIQRRGEARDLRAVFSALAALEVSDNQTQHIATVLHRLLRGSGTVETRVARLKRASPKAEGIVERVVRWATGTAADRSRDAAVRAAAIRALSAAPLSSPEVRALFDQALEGNEPQAVQLAALERLGADPHIDAGRVIVASIAQLSPRVRRSAIDALLSRSDRLDFLKACLSDGQLSASDFSSAQLRRITGEDVDNSNTRTPRSAVVAKYRAALDLTGDRERGRSLFTEHCSPCHRVAGIGEELAPQLAAAWSRGAESVLLAILDPNREVQPEYRDYELVTTDGRVITGIVSTETANSVTLRRAGGERATALRSEIATFRSTGLSLMPEGFEQQLDLQAMADLLSFLSASAEQHEAPQRSAWRAGVARANITPRTPMWMSGYASRTRPAEGKRHDLWAKALAIEDGMGQISVLVTLDLIGIDRALSLAIRRDVCKTLALDLDRVVLLTSHTHTGPVVGTNLLPMYFLSDEERKKIHDYASFLHQSIVAASKEAASRLAPAQFAWGSGTATFATNRRENPERDVPALRAQGRLKGPVDHDVPVLRVSQSGKLLAVVFGYACHCTTLGDQHWSGDYAGYAQIEIERKHPQATALFWAGCGADINPLPRRTVDLARGYGARLAAAVEKVIGSSMHPLSGVLHSSYDEIDLPLARVPSRSEIEIWAKSKNRYEASRARYLLDTLDRDGSLAATYPYPILTWKLGTGPLFVALGGEVVVDYALRLKRALGPRSAWVAAYANDVMAYIPSRRVLAEGGYEGATSMVYYGLPSVWAPELEDMIVETVLRRAREGATAR